jgi:hypothetical protein
MKAQTVRTELKCRAPRLPSGVVGFNSMRGRKFAMALFFASVTVFSALGQFSISWYKISGGGGGSSNGQYIISGTIGQHDAGGPMTGGSYSVTGGFWALYAVQTINAPLLTIVLTPTNTAVVSWPSPSTGFALQQSSSVSGTTWATPPETLHDNGVNKYIVVNPPTGDRYYRLLGP